MQSWHTCALLPGVAGTITVAGCLVWPSRCGALAPVGVAVLVAFVVTRVVGSTLPRTTASRTGCTTTYSMVNQNRFPSAVSTSFLLPFAPSKLPLIPTVHVVIFFIIEQLHGVDLLPAPALPDAVSLAPTSPFSASRCVLVPCGHFELLVSWRYCHCSMPRALRILPQCLSRFILGQRAT